MIRGLAVSASLCGVSAVSAAHPKERDFSAYGWEQFKEEFGRDGDENSVTFLEQLKLIKEHNANPHKKWFASVNQYSDLTPEQFRPLHRGVKRGPNFGGASQPPTPLMTALPDRVDWREQSGVVTPVKNQGGCGSCWAFSAAETLESHLALATGEASPLLSPQQIVSCAPNPEHCGGAGGCQGSTQPLAFNYTETAGITTEASYSYTQTTGTCDTSKISPVAFNSGYVSLPQNDYNALIGAVATVGPIAISIAAGGRKFGRYGGGVYTSCGNDFIMDHAVQLVGYGTEAPIVGSHPRSGSDYWLVRNSWGASWGESGYMRLLRLGDGKERCGVDTNPADGDACDGNTEEPTLCGECAILSSSSYPTGMASAAVTVV